jgi:hypothetical protein
VLSLPSGRKLLVLDAVVAAWLLLWVAIGVAVGESMAALTGLTGAFRAVGDAIGGVGTALGAIDVPVIGAAFDGAAQAIGEAGQAVTARGTAVRGAIERASVLVGAAVALAPTAPVLLAYAPVRLARARDAAALRAFLAAGAGERELQAFLASRARASLSYGQLRRVAERPWDDDPETLRALAAEEARRVGVEEPPARVERPPP